MPRPGDWSFVSYQGVKRSASLRALRLNVFTVRRPTREGRTSATRADECDDPGEDVSRSRAASVSPVGLGDLPG
jgi:hypothetical protein